MDTRDSTAMAGPYAEPIRTCKVIRFCRNHGRGGRDQAARACSVAAARRARRNDDREPRRPRIAEYRNARRT